MSSNLILHGEALIDPPLSADEISYLQGFASTRRMHRGLGPYFILGSGEFGQGMDPDIIHFNRPDPDQPSLWCPWRPDDSGHRLLWSPGDHHFLFDEAVEWLAYLRSHFISLGACSILDPDRAPSGFVPHRLSGSFVAIGPIVTDDLCSILLSEEGVRVRYAEWSAEAYQTLPLLDSFGSPSSLRASLARSALARPSLMEISSESLLIDEFLRESTALRYRIGRERLSLELSCRDPIASKGPLSL